MMGLFDLFFPKRNPSADVAKERLQLVLAHERAGRDAPEFLPQMQRDILAVIGKYVELKDDFVRVNLGKRDSTSVLEINIEFDKARPLPKVSEAGKDAQGKPLPAGARPAQGKPLPGKPMGKQAQQPG